MASAAGGRADISWTPTGYGSQGREEAAAASQPAWLKCVCEGAEPPAGWQSHRSSIRAALQTLAPDLRRICAPGMTFEG